VRSPTRHPAGFLVFFGVVFVLVILLIGLAIYVGGHFIQKFW
jgi:hypothetical protein